MRTLIGNARFTLRHSYLLVFFVVGVWLGKTHVAHATLSSTTVASAPQPLDDPEIVCADGKPPLPISSPPPVPAPPNNTGTECDWYGTLEDRGNCDGAGNQSNRDKLGGYTQTCRNMTNSAQAGACPNAPDFDDYVNGMRFCLQTSSKADLCDAQGCLKGNLTCTDIVNDVAKAHSGCNAQQKFCDLSCQSLSCFGGAIGDAWGGWLMGTGNGGPITPIGAINTALQVLVCDPANKVKMVGCMCQGYYNACLQKAGADPENPHWRDRFIRALCYMSCPTAPIIPKSVFAR
jgi:hypothetical protein